MLNSPLGQAPGAPGRCSGPPLRRKTTCKQLQRRKARALFLFSYWFPHFTGYGGLCEVRGTPLIETSAPPHFVRHTKTPTNDAPARARARATKHPRTHVYVEGPSLFPQISTKLGAALGETGNKFLARNPKSAVFLETASVSFPRITKNIKKKTPLGPNRPPLFSRHFAQNSATSLPNQFCAGMVAKIRGGETSVSRGA